MNLEAFEAMANSNHRFGAFEETVSALLFILHPMPYTLYPPLEGDKGDTL